MRLFSSIVLALIAFPGFATANTPDEAECSPDATAIARAAAGVKRPLRLKIPTNPQPRPGDDGVRAGPGSIIFMNKNGGTYYGANFEDATSNQSTIVNGTDNVPPFPYSAAVWDDVMDCMQEIFAPYDVVITDVDPGNVEHFESVVTSEPSAIGQPNYVGGVAPFSCGVIDNAIVWTFASVWGPSARDICETAAQETAHAFGLDHEYYCPDPMTYLFGCGNKAFRDYNAPCGEDGPRSCTCGGASTQNSHDEIMAIFGGQSAEPPVVDILQPRDDSQVTAGFIITVEASDDISVQRVDFYIDGDFVGSDTSSPFSENTSDSLAQGPHTIEVRAFDGNGLSDSAQVNVTLTGPCGDDSDCDQSYELCISGACVVGPDVNDGLGDTCETDADCLGGQCASAGEEKYCVEFCDDIGGSECPEGYSCVSAGSRGVCWPNSTGGGGGATGGCVVSTSGSTGAQFGLAALVVGLFLVFRRRGRGA
jgi:hypothetical protein